jgi:hypothetical protein
MRWVSTEPTVGAARCRSDRSSPVQTLRASSEAPLARDPTDIGPSHPIGSAVTHPFTLDLFFGQPCEVQVGGVGRCVRWGLVPSLLARSVPAYTHPAPPLSPHRPAHIPRTSDEDAAASVYGYTGTPRDQQTVRFVSPCVGGLWWGDVSIFQVLRWDPSSGSGPRFLWLSLEEDECEWCEALPRHVRVRCHTADA